MWTHDCPSEGEIETNDGEPCSWCDAVSMIALPLSGVPSADQILRLQGEMAKLPQVELPTDHFFANGMYARRLFRKAGTLIVGKVHRHEHFFMLMYGDLEVWTETGMKRIGPGEIIVSKPGTKRVTLAHADSVAVTVHRTKHRDLDKIERQIIEPEEGALFDANNRLKEGLLK